ncbi:AAA family ATPase [Lentzea tibetensis]|uniref:AAA family ATPase n=1 Tax=Lentzea tibetensis TaxID=2591470 RepID=A0A563EIQ7_9PSEU|nr:LuxR family transcriptional regulator [Lentzea tibetensis]TWP46715.1 AAA family ATPase [Lentzea tibetensis]
MQTRAPVVIGRDKEVIQLERALEDARHGHGRAVFLVGEAGIGKSRLARLVAGRAFDEGMRVLRGRGTTIGPMVPFRPIAEALLSLFRGGEPPDDAELGPYKPVLGRLIPEWSDHRQAGDSLVVLAEAVLRLLSVVGRKNPCVMILEDLHDADAETLAVIEYLVDNLDYQPVMVLATIRDEPGNALEVVRLAARRDAGLLLSLKPLDRNQVSRMAAACLESQDMPDEVTDRLWHDSAGNPFVVEELLHGMVSGGLLVPGAGGWHVLGQLRVEVPESLVRSIAHRTDRLGPEGRELLSVAAVLGHRFSLSVVQRVTGADDRSLLSHLHAGVAAQLVTPDEPAPDWYAFRHPLTADALLTQLNPADRASLSRRTADAIEALHPGLPGDWCPLVASLRLDAGETASGGALLAEAGRRALGSGAAGSAVSLLDRANRLLASQVDVDVRADVLESLLPALSEAGQFERAFQLADTLTELSTAGLDRFRRAALHTRLARVAYLAGRWTDGSTQISTARTLLGPDAGEEHTAEVDVISAFLALNTPSPDRIASAGVLARRAADAADRAGLPVVCCEAWQLLGVIAREQDLDEANRCFDRARQLAEEHNLPIQRIYALVRVAGNDWLRNGTTTGLERAHEEALRVGAITVAYNVDAIVALQSVLCGDYVLAGQQIDACLEATNRLQLGGLTRYLLMTKAAWAAHQGKRHEMEEAVTAFLAGARGGLPELPLCFGLARAFCALLEENRDLAESELAKALSYEAENPTTFHLSGRHGLHLLLSVLAGRAGWPHHEEIVASSPSGMRWNRHFALLAHAVLLGRDGRLTEADAAVAAAQEVASSYPMARYLGLRLIASAAHSDGWGSPVAWLRAAEEHFHQAQVGAVASACRGLLRQVGVPVQQRRSGTEQVPAPLRASGVTAREYEVFVLLAERMGNKAIATRLHISPRTVEKHVASLIAKTGTPDREALSTYAASPL